MSICGVSNPRTSRKYPLAGQVRTTQAGSAGSPPVLRAITVKVTRSPSSGLSGETVTRVVEKSGPAALTATVRATIDSHARSVCIRLVVKDVLEPRVAERMRPEEGCEFRHPDIDQDTLAGNPVTLQPQNDRPVLDRDRRPLRDGDAHHDFVVPGDLADRAASPRDVSEEIREQRVARGLDL